MMSREELKAKLTELGIPFQPRLGEKKLMELLPKEYAESVQSESKDDEGQKDAHEEGQEEVRPQYSEAQIQDIVKDLGKKSIPEEMLAKTQRDDGEVRTESGIIIPREALAHLTKTKYEFVLQCTGEQCSVNKCDPNGKMTFVRRYERTVHGDGFRELAEQFVQKRNT